MVIQKVINNNVISAYDVNQQEIGKYVIICTLII